MNKHLQMLKLAAKGYDVFSNMAPYEIEIDGVCWPTAEHYYQAMKFENESIRKRIRRTENPFLAASLGNDRRMPIRKDWDQIRVEVMFQAMKTKFEQHADIREMLLATGDKKLVDHTATDEFWGEGADGKGENMVGLLLMRIRGILQRGRDSVKRQMAWLAVEEPREGHIA